MSPYDTSNTNTDFSLRTMIYGNYNIVKIKTYVLFSDTFLYSLKLLPL